MKADTQNASAGFTAWQWITNGGSAIAVDSDPNSVAPPASRVFYPPTSIFIGSFEAGNGNTLTSTNISPCAADGTSVTVRAWWYDDTQSLWIPESSGPTLTYASTNVSNIAMRCMPGVKHFLQVTSNTGVTKIAVLVR